MASINEQGRIEYKQISRLVTVTLNYQKGKDGKATDNTIWWATLPQKIVTKVMGKFKSRDDLDSDSTHSAWGVWLDGELWVAECTSRYREGRVDLYLDDIKRLGMGCKEIYSISERSRKKNGARWIKATDLMPDKAHADRWILLEEDMNSRGFKLRKLKSETDIRSMIDRANSLMDVGYDFAGVTVGFYKWWKRDSVQVIKKGKEYCSAFCELIRAGVTIAISPQRLYRKTVLRGAKKIESTWEYISRTDRNIRT